LLDELATGCGESAYLAVSDRRVATYVATAESPRAIRHVGWIGQTVSLDGTAVGAALAESGRCAVRTGAIEPDITAVSRAVPADLPFGVAVSVIGPAHRMDGPAITAVEAALEGVVARLAADLGTQQETLS
ncbi:MAG: IclR family transcriptional regulator, partial [Acidimicrobiia bacterium]|nr:IclR family transcriptional regulator [Acidimicrobiia bacterium]